MCTKCLGKKLNKFMQGKIHLDYLDQTFFPLLGQVLYSRSGRTLQHALLCLPCNSCIYHINLWISWARLSKSILRIFFYLYTHKYNGTFTGSFSHTCSAVQGNWQASAIAVSASFALFPHFTSPILSTRPSSTICADVLEKVPFWATKATIWSFICITFKREMQPF